MNQITFEFASVSDAERAAELFLEGKSIDRSAAIELFEEEFRLCEIQPDQRTYVLAKTSSSLIAYAGARFYDQHTDENMYGTVQLLPTGWYLRGLKVHPEWRRAGIARELTKRRLSWISERASTAHVFLNDESKETLPMYQELGFEVVSRGLEFLNYDHKRPDQRGVLLRLEF